MVLLFLVSYANASKILLLDKVETTNIDFTANGGDKDPIHYSKKYFINTFWNDLGVYDYNLKKNNKLSKALESYLKGKWEILGANGDLVFLLDQSNNLKNGLNRIKIRAVNLIRNRIVFTKKIAIPDGKMQFIAANHYKRVANKNYMLFFSQKRGDEKTYLYILSFNDHGKYEIKKIMEKKDKRADYVGKAVFSRFDGNVYIGSSRYNIKTQKTTTLPNFKCNGIVAPLSKNILLCREGERGSYKLSAYDIMDKTNFVFFYTRYDAMTGPINFWGDGDGDGDIFISYEHFPSADSNPYERIYMLDAKNKVLMGNGDMYSRDMEDDKHIVIIKHVPMRKGVYLYVVHNRHTHKAYRYLLVNTKKLRDYKYIKPSFLRDFHHIAPSLKLKHPKVILTKNNIYLNYYYYDDYGVVISSKIPYMIQDDNKLYVLVHQSFFNNNNKYSANMLFDIKFKLKLKSKILESNAFYPNNDDKLYKINSDQDEPGFTRIVVFNLPKDFKLKKGDILTTGEVLHPKKDLYIVPNLKVGHIF